MFADPTPRQACCNSVRCCVAVVQSCKGSWRVPLDCKVRVIISLAEHLEPNVAAEVRTREVR